MSKEDKLFFGLTAFSQLIWILDAYEGYSIASYIGFYLGGLIGCYIIPTAIYLVIRIFKKIEFLFAHIFAFCISLMSIAGKIFYS